MRLTPILLLGALLACSDSTNPTTTGTPGPSEVWMQGSVFNPATRTVTSGTTVTFTNKDGVTHNVTSDAVPAGAGPFDSGPLSPNGVYTVNGSVLTVPGTYQYHCNIHGSPGAGMHGTIIVN